MPNYAYGALGVEVYADTHRLPGDVEKASKEAGAKGGRAAGAAWGKGFLELAAVVAGERLFDKMIEGAETAEKVNKATEAVIRSTGGAAHVTAEQVNELGQSIMKKTGIDDESIKSGENMLLTFRNVRNEAGKGNDIFNQSTSILTDMTAAMTGGQVTQEGMRHSAIQLGKALNDPLAGLGALTRVGVTFTQQQKDQVKALVKSGDTLDAQKIILAELSKEFGGAAAAYATPMSRLKTATNELTESMGTALLPVISTVATWMTNVGIPALQTFGHWLAQNKTWVVPLASALGTLVTTLYLISKAFAVAEAAAALFGTTLELSLGPITLIIAGIIALGVGLYLLWTRCTTFRVIVEAAFHGVMVAFGWVKHAAMDVVGVLPLVSGVFDGVVHAVQAAAAPFIAVFTTIRDVVTRSFTAWWAANGEAIKAIWNAVWTSARDTFLPLWNAIVIAVRIGWTILSTIFKAEIALLTIEWRLFWSVITTIARVSWIVITTLFKVYMSIIHGAWGVFTATLTLMWRLFWAGVQMVAKIAWDVLVGIFTVAINLLTGRWGAAWNAMRNTGIQIWNAISGYFRNALGAFTGWWSQAWNSIAGAVAGALRAGVSGAVSAGSALIDGLKNGMVNAIRSIGSWIKGNIVDPIIGAVKRFFGIKSPSTVMAEIGTNLTRGLFKGMVPGISGIGNLVTSVFGGFPQALGGLLAHGLVGIAGLPGKALNAIMSLFGGGGDATRLAAEAGKYAGHRYVWGGPANAQAGFDCSSFVNFVAGSLGLPLPGGFKAPSDQHGPNTGMWLGFGTMKRMTQAMMAMNDLYVNSHHMGIVTGPGTGFAARSTATGTGPQGVGGDYSILRFPGGGVKLPPWLEGIRGKVMGMFSKVGGFFSRLFGGGPSGGQGNPTAGVQQWAGIAMQVLNMFGEGQYLSSLLAQMQTESGGNRAAINNWDVNARMGTPSKGLMQVIDPTFAAYAGPFRSRGIWDPLANIYAAVAYAISRYGSNLASVWGHGHGYAAGGMITEPITGFGWRSGQMYHFGERGPELVTPLGAGGGRETIVINVYPRANQSEVEIAAAVSRNLGWAQATGRA